MKLRMFLIGPVLIASGACGSSNPTTTVDAPKAAIDAAHSTIDAAVVPHDDASTATYDFSCMGNAAPTTASATVTISGSVEEVSSSFAVTAPSGAALKACKNGAANCSGNNLVGSATSANDGSFSIGPMTTGSAPLDAYFEMTKSGDVTVYAFPASPLVMNYTGVPVLTLNNSTLSEIAGVVGQDDGNAILGIAVTDCQNKAITDTANVVLTVKQNGTAVTGTTVENASMFSPSDAGSYLVFNVPPGNTDIGATYNGQALRTHTVAAVANAMTQTQLRPGF